MLRVIIKRNEEKIAIPYLNKANDFSIPKSDMCVLTLKKIYIMRKRPSKSGEYFMEKIHEKGFVPPFQIISQRYPFRLQPWNGHVKLSIFIFHVRSRGSFFASISYTQCKRITFLIALYLLGHSQARPNLGKNYRGIQLLVKGISKSHYKVLALHNQFSSKVLFFF